MKEKIDRLAKGIVDAELPELVLEPSSWEDKVSTGVPYRRDVYVSSRNGMNVKGLAYSSHSCVEVLDPSFGGLRNRVHFEVHTDHLEPGDQIEGAFCFVTNGGEKKLPYSFRVESGGSAGLLSQMGSVEEFAAFARRDWDLAVRLFDYRDFPEAPFMQDMHLCSLYEGLKGGPDRSNMLEEFLVAAGAKKPVEVYILPDSRVYRYPGSSAEDHVKIARVGWGYLSVRLEAEGEFIRLSRSWVTDEDFTDEWVSIPYQIDLSRLHPGKNYGSIRLGTVRSTAVIEIEATGPGRVLEPSDSYSRNVFLQYLSLRLDYESGRYEAAPLLEQMAKELDGLSKDHAGQDGLLLSLLRAEACLLEGKRESAYGFLKECRESAAAGRQDRPELYFFHLYLMWLYEQHTGQREALMDQVRQCWEEDHRRQYLFLLLLKLDEGIQLNPGSLLRQMEDVYDHGSHSPFLYQEACLMLLREPRLLRGLGSFELQVLNYGVRRELITPELAEQVAKTAMGARHYHKLAHRVLMDLYRQYPVQSVLEAVCCMMIKGERRSEVDFPWYERALEVGISLTRLYEHFLYSLPESYGHLLPREVLIYFSYEKSLDQKSRSVLYMNLLNYCPDTDPMYQAYERDMEQFAMEQLFQSRIDRRLAVIYQHILYKDMVDDRVARVLPSILHSYRVECRCPQMLYVVLCYEELKGEAAFPLKDGVAYIPMFSSHSTLLFQDGYGNRYSNIRHMKIPVMPDDELEKQCFEVYPEHPLLRLKACREILDGNTLEEGRAYELEQAIQDLDLHPLFRKKLMSCLIDYYQQESLLDGEDEMGYAGQFMVQLDKEKLNREERGKICESLIHLGYYKEAYAMVQEFGGEDLRPASQLKLCAKVIMQSLFNEDPCLLHLSYRAFASGHIEGAVLDYLCEHYNGSTDEMYRILVKSVKEHIETYDLEERLLDQMLFSGERGHLDRVFHLYHTRKSPGDSRIRAYLTVKSTEYFVEEREVKKTVFGYLERHIAKQPEVSKVPTIYLLALTKHYADLKELEPDQARLCQEAVAYLLKERMVFLHFKWLSRYVELPDSVMGQAILQYHGGRGSRIELRLRVLPYEEAFHAEEMQRVFQGFFIHQKTLFEGETLEYQIEETRASGQKVRRDGSIASGEQIITSQDRRFQSLNEMARCVKEGREQELKTAMREYLVYTAAAQELFQIR